MIGLFRFSPSRLALVYVALSALVLGLFAIPLWYVWRVNYSTLRTYIDAEDVRTIVDTFEREGPTGLAAAIEARVLFAAGWSACFFSAIKLVAGKKKVSLPADVAIDAEVDLGTTHGVFGLAARLNVSLSGMDRQAAQALVEAALAELQDTLRLVAAKDGGDDVVTIHQDAKVFASRITAGASLAHKLGPGRHAWIQVIDGALKLNGLSLTSGDGAAVSDEGQLRLDALAPSHFVLFDLA